MSLSRPLTGSVTFGMEVFVVRRRDVQLTRFARQTSGRTPPLTGWIVRSARFGNEIALISTTGKRVVHDRSGGEDLVRHVTRDVLGIST